MTTVAEIKKFILRMLLAFNGQAVRERELIRVVNEGFTRTPLLSDVKDAIRELQSAELVLGAQDDLDPDERTWSLTTNGVHRAKKLN